MRGSLLPWVFVKKFKSGLVFTCVFTKSDPNLLFLFLFYQNFRFLGGFLGFFNLFSLSIHES